MKPSMAVAVQVIAALITLACLVTSLPTQSSDTIDIMMPKVKPQTPDIYLCMAVEVKDAHRYLTSFKTKADAMIAHHILLYGCIEPGAKPGQVWNCGEMMSSQSDYNQGPVCSDGSNIVYAWAMDAPKLTLPEGVSFDVGQNTDIKYLVLQVHYKNVSKFLPPVNGDDSSGVSIETSMTPTPKQAGVYLMVTDGAIPPHSIEYFETACTYEEKPTIVPFAFRTHAHSLGRVISGYRVRDGQWSEIGRKDPRLPEMFYNATTPGLEVRTGDILAARCTMENTEDHVVRIGSTQKDEMCNFYIMFYVDGAPIPNNHVCSSAGPPQWYFPNFENLSKLNPGAIPSTASVVPDSGMKYIRNATYPGYLAEDDSEVRDVVDGMPGEFQDGDDSGINMLFEEAIQEMDPDELAYLVQQLAEEEAEQERRNQIWQQRQYARWQQARQF